LWIQNSKHLEHHSKSFIRKEDEKDDTEVAVVSAVSCDEENRRISSFGDFEQGVFMKFTL